MRLCASCKIVDTYFAKSHELCQICNVQLSVNLGIMSKYIRCTLQITNCICCSVSSPPAMPCCAPAHWNLSNTWSQIIATIIFFLSFWLFYSFCWYAQRIVKKTKIVFIDSYNSMSMLYEKRPSNVHNVIARNSLLLCVLCSMCMHESVDADVLFYALYNIVHFRSIMATTF